jgi:hypothetical protein
MEELKQKLTKFYISTSVDESDDILDENRVLEESPNGRWNKLATEISIQILFDFDTIHLAIDTEKGLELAWNEIHLDQLKVKLNNETQIKKFDSNIKIILNYLIKLDHLNILTFYDYWYNKNESKWIVITELSTAGSLKKLLDNSRQTKTPIKPKTYKRWLNQLLNAMIYIHLQHVSIFQGNLNTEKIFIQNNSAIKIAPSLLNLCLKNNSPEVVHSEKRCINNILNFDNDIVDKDLYSLGLIAIEIFTAHLNLNSVVSNLSLTAAATTSANIQLIAKLVKENMYEKIKQIFDFDQFNFIYNCLSPNEEIRIEEEETSEPLSPMSASLELIAKSVNRKKLKIEYLLYQPLVNEIYSLKVLSIYSLLVYFQDKHLNKLNLHRGKKSIISEDDTVGNNDNILNKILNIKYDLINDTNKNNNTHATETKSFSRKVSLNSLANTINLPKDFFGILEDIKLGCYPRLYSHYINNLNASVNLLKNIPSSNSINKVFNQFNNNNSNNFNYRRPSNLNLSCSNNGSNTNLCSNSIKKENWNNDNVFNLTNDTCEQVTDNQYNPETRRIKSENCTLSKCLKNSDFHQLVLKLKFDDDFCRTLECTLSSVDLCLSNIFDKKEVQTKLYEFCLILANELIDFGLINDKDKEILTDILVKTLVKCY